MITATEQKLRAGTVLWLADNVRALYHDRAGMFVVEVLNQLAPTWVDKTFYWSYEDMRDAIGSLLVGAREVSNVHDVV